VKFICRFLLVMDLSHPHGSTAAASAFTAKDLAAAGVAEAAEFEYEDERRPAGMQAKPTLKKHSRAW
jgi:hypothetical protein